MCNVEKNQPIYFKEWNYFYVTKFNNLRFFCKKNKTSVHPSWEREWLVVGCCFVIYIFAWREENKWFYFYLQKKKGGTKERVHADEGVCGCWWATPSPAGLSELPLLFSSRKARDSHLTSHFSLSLPLKAHRFLPSKTFHPQNPHQKKEKRKKRKKENKKKINPPNLSLSKIKYHFSM